MKRSLILICILLISAFNAFAIDVTPIETAITKQMQARDKSLTVKVQEMKALDNPKGFSYLKVTIFKDNKEVNSQFLFSDGKVIAQDFLTVNTMDSLAKDLEFDYATPKKIDVSSLSLVKGNKNAKNIIVEVTDFQCPFCKKASEYLHNKIASRNDIALYIIHMPLEIHPHAPTMAKVFEAGMKMGKNFAEDLFKADYISALNEEITKLQARNVSQEELQKKAEALIKEYDEKIINEYAKKSGNASKFKALVASSEIEKKLADSKALALSLGAESTPTIFVNGKAISGYDEKALDKAFKTLR